MDKKKILKRLDTIEDLLNDIWRNSTNFSQQEADACLDVMDAIEKFTDLIEKETTK